VVSQVGSRHRPLTAGVMCPVLPRVDEVALFGSVTLS